MFDALRLLDQFLGAGTGERVNQMTGGKLAEVQNTLQTQGVQGVLDQARGAVEQGVQNVQNAATQAPGSIGDMVSQAQQSYQTGGLQGVLEQGKTLLQQNAGGLLTGAVAGTLATVLLGTRGGRAVGGAALKLGGLAAVGGLAYMAYRNWQNGQAPQQATPALEKPPVESGFASGDAPDASERAMIAMRAMIAAAKADGHIDDAERARIMGRLDTLGLEPAAREFVDQEMAAPLDLDALVATATTVERAIELYAASVVAIDPDTDAEQAYLDELAGRLGLNADLRSHLDAQASAVRSS